MTPCPVSIRGQYFPSQKAAAEALGVTPAAISQTLLRHGHCDRLGAPSGAVGNQNATAVPVQIGALRFRSVKSAAEQLGVSRSTLSRFMVGKSGQTARETIIAAAMRFSRFGPVAEVGQ